MAKRNMPNGTNNAVASMMIEDFAYSKSPLLCTQILENTELVEMYYGPKKIDQGKRTLLSKSKPFKTADSNNGSDLKPYQSEEDDDGDNHDDLTAHERLFSPNCFDINT